VYNGALDASVSDFQAPSSETANLPDCFLEIPFILSSVSVIYKLPNNLVQTAPVAQNPYVFAPGFQLRLTAQDLCRIYLDPTETWEDILSRPYNLDNTVTFGTPFHSIEHVARFDASSINQAFNTYLSECGGSCTVISGSQFPPSFDVSATPAFSDTQVISTVQSSAHGAIGYVGTGSNLSSVAPHSPAALLLEAGVPVPTTNGHNSQFLAPTDNNVRAAQINNSSCTNLICQPSAYPIVTAEFIDLFGTQPTSFVACNLIQFVLFLLTQGQKLNIPGFVSMTQECLCESKEFLDDISTAICQPCIPPCIPCASPEFCPPTCPTCATC